MRVRFPYDYSSHIGTWNAGDIADVDDTTGEWLKRDANAEEVTESDAARQQTKPKNRQRTRPRNDRGTGPVIDRGNFKAVKD